MRDSFVGFALVGLLAACGEHNGDESPETETICQKINPCENGGMCASVPDGSFTCTCVDNWSGDRCNKVNARSYNLVKTVEPALIPLLVRRNALVTETGPGVLARLRLTRARRAIATHAEVMVVVKKSRTEALHVAAQIIGVALDVTKVNARNCNPAKTAERAPTHRTEALCAVACLNGVETFAS